jgi:hypothetical protein
MNRLLASFLVLALAFTPASVVHASELSGGGSSFDGRVYASERGDEVAGATVYALHLDTKQVFRSDLTDRSGRYLIRGLPTGYYDLIVEADGKLYLGNRVLDAPAGESVEVSLVLGPPNPEDTQWWSAAPDRPIAGLNRPPDGVARIVEDRPRPGAVIPGETTRAATGAAEGAMRAASAQGAGFWASNASWLVPTLAAVGITAGGFVLTDDNDADDQPGSPFE